MFKKLITVGLLAGALVGIPSAAQATTGHATNWDASTCAAFHSWERTGNEHTFQIMVERSKFASWFLHADVTHLLRHRNSQSKRFVRTDCSTLSGYGL